MTPGRRELLVFEVLPVPRGCRVPPDHRVIPGLLVRPALKDLLVIQEPRDRRVHKEIPDHRVLLVFKDHRV